MDTCQAETLKREISSYIPFLSTADLCDRNAHRFPKKEALVDHRRRLTWREVWVLSNKLALTLRELGLSQSRPLLVQLPNCVELFLARLACEKAGVGCVTVSPLFRAAELKQILHHTQPGAALSLRFYRGVDIPQLIQEAGYAAAMEFLIVGDDVPRGAISVDELFKESIDLEEAERILKTSRLGPLEGCQIATTSGSTGLPKCVDVRIYTRLLTGAIQARRFDLTQSDTIAPLAPIISGTSEALGYFAVALLGARAFLIDRFGSEEVLHCVVEEKVTFLCLVPTMLAKMASLVEKLKPETKSLKGIVSYGSLLPVSMAERMEQVLGAKIVQAYGTMDYGGIAATFINDDVNVRIGTVGRPLEGNEVIVCGDDGRPIPSGEVGYIRVRGLHAVGRYYNSPDLDNEKWTGGYFDVGEIGRFDTNGNLVVLGRSDHVIIRGGQNIYPEDLENLVAQHPGVEETAVVGIPDPTYGERVCAFVSLRPGWEISLSELVDFLKKKEVARFKLPEFLEILPDLPRVPTGQKVDRKELFRRARELNQRGKIS